MSTVKTALGTARVHLEPMRGRFEDNEKYCSKQGELLEFGTKPARNGERVDYTAFYDALKSGKTDLELMESDFNAFNKFSKTVDRFRSLTPPVRTQELIVVIFYGPPGTGKTEMAMEPVDGVVPYRLPLGKNFWLTPAACGVKDVVIDDFKCNISLTDLLQLLDKYPVECERKGAHLWWAPNYITITTNKNPWDWYTYNDRDWEREALFRRIRAAFRFDKHESGRPHPVQLEDSWRTDRTVFDGKPVARSLGLSGGNLVAVDLHVNPENDYYNEYYQ